MKVPLYKLIHHIQHYFGSLYISHVIFESKWFAIPQGVRTVKEEMGDMGETLIDVTQGHGIQGLINLLITGRASPHVWDGTKNVGGLGE